MHRRPKSSPHDWRIARNCRILTRNDPAWALPPRSGLLEQFVQAEPASLLRSNVWLFDCCSSPIRALRVGLTQALGLTFNEFVPQPLGQHRNPTFTSPRDLRVR